MNNTSARHTFYHNIILAKEEKYTVAMIERYASSEKDYPV